MFVSLRVMAGFIEHGLGGFGTVTPDKVEEKREDQLGALFDQAVQKYELREKEWEDHDRRTG